MNKYAMLLAMCSILINASAQHDSTKISARKYELGVQTGSYSTSYIQGLNNFYAYFTIRKGIHEFAIGPSIGRAPVFDLYYTAERPYRLTGIDLAYRILPNGPGKVFDFYFQLNYFQKWTGSTGTTALYEVYAPNTIEQIKTNSAASQLIVEYGFDVRFLKHFYLGLGMGIGGKYVSVNYNYETHDDLDYKTTTWSLDLILRTHVGFRF